LSTTSVSGAGATCIAFSAFYVSGTVGLYTTSVSGAGATCIAFSVSCTGPVTFSVSDPNADVISFSVSGNDAMLQLMFSILLVLFLVVHDDLGVPNVSLLFNIGIANGDVGGERTTA
jgi:hypothetical protein